MSLWFSGKIEQYPHFNSEEHMADKEEDFLELFPPNHFRDEFGESETKKASPTIFIVLVVISVLLIVMLLSALIGYFIVSRRKRKAYNVEQSRQKHQKDVILVNKV